MKLQRIGLVVTVMALASGSAEGIEDGPASPPATPRGRLDLSVLGGYAMLQPGTTERESGGFATSARAEYVARPPFAVGLFVDGWPRWGEMTLVGLSLGVEHERPDAPSPRARLAAGIGSGVAYLSAAVGLAFARPGPVFGLVELAYERCGTREYVAYFGGGTNRPPPPHWAWTWTPVWTVRVGLGFRGF